MTVISTNVPCSLQRSEPRRSLLAARVPDADGAVVAAGGEEAAVRAEGEAGDFVAVAAKCSDFVTGGGIPQDDRSVVTGRGQVDAVRAEGQAGHVGRMCRESHDN